MNGKDVYTIARSRRDNISNLRLCWVLTKCTEEIAQDFTGNGASAAFIEQGKRLLVLYMFVSFVREFLKGNTDLRCRSERRY